MRFSEIPFTDFPLDRADDMRKDATAIEAAWADPASVIVYWRGKPLVERGEPGMVPVRLGRGEAPQSVATRLLLGRDEAGGVHFAVSLDPGIDAPTPPRGSFEDLRPVAGQLSLDDAALLGTARSVFAWHRSHGFCSKCGTASEVASAGWRRVCPACGTEHFPRVDPVVIALVTHGDAVLLGRGPQWPPGFFSCLAGFVEPGETLGEATRREVFEEAGVRVGSVSYLFGQPWPFPSSLMLGVRAAAVDRAVTVDEHELAEARWFDREAVKAIMEGTHPEVRPPFPIAVAHHLLRWWLEHG